MMNLDYFYVPPIPETLINCIGYMYNSDFNYDVLIKKITSDIGITEKILSTANSQYYSQGSVSTNNLKQAVIRIGYNNLLKILTAQYYKSTYKNIEADFFTLRDFNRHSSYVSHLAVSLGEHLHVEDTNDLMIAGLFHDVGLIARSYCQNKIMQDIINKCKQNKADFYSVEKTETLPTHDFLGKQVANKWNLSERVSFLIEHHHTPESEKTKNGDSSLHLELDILTFADTLAHSMKCGFKNYNREIKVSKQFLDRLGLSVETVTKKANDTLSAVSALAF